MAYDIKHIILKNWDILLSDPSLAAAFPEPPAFTFRRAPTLQDTLVSSHLPPSKPTTWLSKPLPTGTFRCGACNHCSNVHKTSTFPDVFTGRTYQCRHFANCNSTFVVYRLECECGAFYIGRTKRRMRDRLAEHKYAIRTQNPNYPMAEHYRVAGHTNIDRLKIMAIEVIPRSYRGGDRLKRLLQRETYWISTLKATSPPGLNEEIDFTPFL